MIWFGRQTKLKINRITVSFANNPKPEFMQIQSAQPQYKMKTKTIRSVFQILKAIPVASVLAALAFMCVSLQTQAAPTTIWFTNVYGGATALSPLGGQSGTNSINFTNADPGSIRIECWGGGGGGGGARYSTNSCSGGGGGGAYARTNTYTYNPSYTYYVLIPTNATAGNGAANGANGGTAQLIGVTSGNVTNVIISAPGGTGGKLGNGTSKVNGLGGAGGTIPAGTWLDGQFNGGNGADGYTNSSSVFTGGGGGSGASDTSAGVSATDINGATNLLGSDTLHYGGYGSAGKSGDGNNGNKAGAPGGGGGGTCSTNAIRTGSAGALGQMVIIWSQTAPYSNVHKSNNIVNLNLTNSWVENYLPRVGVTATWDSMAGSATTNSLGGALTCQGLIISNPAALVQISADGNTLTLGSGGIDMSAATKDLTLNCGLAPSAGGTWNVASGRTLTVGGQISGSSGFSTAGAGKVVLAASNSFSGNLTINGSTVQIENLSAIPTNCSVVADAGRLDLNGNPLVMGGGLNGAAGTVDNSAPSATTLTLNGTGTFSGTITNSGGLLTLVAGGGSGKTVTLSNANYYAGGTIISNSSVIAVATTNALGSGTVVFNGGGQLLMLDGALLSNSIEITNCNLPNNSSAIKGPSTNSSSLVVTARVTGPIHVTYPLTNANSGHFEIPSYDNPGCFLELSGAITAAPGVRVKQRVGLVVYSGGGTGYDALEVVASGQRGIAAVGANNGISTTATVTLGNSATGKPAVLDLNGYNQTLVNLTNGAAAANACVTNSSTSTDSTLTITAGAGTCGAAITDDPASGGAKLNLALLGGSLAIPNINTYHGTTTVGGGRLQVQAGGSCANSDVTLNNTAGSMLGLSVTDVNQQWTCQSLTTSGSNSGLGFDFGVNTPSTTVAPMMVSGGTVTFNGGVPTVTITGTSLPLGSYPLMYCPSGLPGIPNLILPPRVAGNLSSDGVTLTLNVTTAGPVEPLLWAAGNGTWNTISAVNWVDSVGLYMPYVDADSVMFEDSRSIGSGPITVTLNSTVAPTTVTGNSAKNWAISGSGVIAGSGSLSMQGSGTFKLATTNTFSGGATVSAGILEADTASALGTGLLTMSGGALSNNASTTLSNMVNLTVPSVIGVGSGQTLTMGGMITNGNGALTKTGNGTLVLAANNTYTNGTTISGGTLSIQSVAVPGTYDIASGATLSFDTTNSAMNKGAFIGAGTLKLANSVSFNVSSNTYVSLSAGGLVWVTGGASVTGSASSRGFWTNNLGSLQVDAGSTINFNEAGNTNAGYAQFDALNGGGTVQLGWTNSPVRTLILGVNNSSGSFSGTLANSGTNGAMILQKVGAGTQTLSGTNTYTGSTIISAGTLALSGNGSISNTTNIVVSNGAIFKVSGLSSAFTLGASQILSNSAPGAIINGTNNCSAGTISVVYDATNSSFIITNGGMTLSSGNPNTFKINNTGPTLGIGSYRIIARAASGNVGLVAGTVPSSVAIGGNGKVTGVASPLLRIGAGELYLDVPPTQPLLGNNGPITAGGTLNLTATNNSGGTNYSWTGPNGFTSSQQNPSIPNATTAASGNYFCTVTVNGVTSAAAMTTVTVNPGASSPAHITSVHVDSNGNLIITGTNGAASGTYWVLTSTNLTAPLSTWVTNTTGTFSGSGTFSNSIPVSGTARQQFFNIKQP